MKTNKQNSSREGILAIIFFIDLGKEKMDGKGWEKWGEMERNVERFQSRKILNVL